MRIQILVRLKAGVLDVQGKAVENTLASLASSDSSFKTAENVRIGKLIEIDVEASDFDTAKKEAEKLCEKILVNPIIENYEIKAA